MDARTEVAIVVRWIGYEIPLLHVTNKTVLGFTPAYLLKWLPQPFCVKMKQPSSAYHELHTRCDSEPLGMCPHGVAIRVSLANTRIQDVFGHVRDLQSTCWGDASLPMCRRMAVTYKNKVISPVAADGRAVATMIKG